MDSKLYPLLPDFLIIGAGKSGTTSLDNYLKQHPEIFISRVKEPNFFGYENKSIEDFGGNLAEIKHFEGSVTILEDYLQLFKDAKPGQLKGETSNTYLYHEQAPERIKHYNPDVKLIAILRQPAGRLYSRYLHLARENRLPSEHFEDCLNTGTIWWERNDLIKEGFYFKNLSRYYNIFPEKQIRVYLYEEFSQKPDDVLVDIYNFLGVDTSFKADLTVRYNKSGFIKNRFLDRLYGQSGILTTAIKRAVPAAMIERLKNSLVLQKGINNLRSKNLHQPRLDDAFKKRLTTEVYGDDILKLQKLIHRDLSRWLS